MAPRLLRRRQRPSLSTIVAAGQLLERDPADKTVDWARKREEWQTRAWEFFDVIIEVRFVARSVGDVFARVPWYVGVRPDSSATPVPVDSEIKEFPPNWPAELTYDQEEADIVLSLLDDLSSPYGGASEIRRQIGISLFVPGECYLLGAVKDGDSEERVWQVRSPEEVKFDPSKKVTNAAGKEVPYTELVEPGKNTGGKPLSPDSPIIRIWRPHPRRQEWADSPMRSALEVLEELLILTRAIQGAAISRLAGPGILILPNSLRDSNGAQRDGQAGRTSSVVGDIIAAAGMAISDPSSATSQVPLVFFVDDDVYEKVTNGKALIQWDRSVDEIAARTRQELLTRFANGIDWPAEMLTGLGSTNHWCQSSDTAILVRGRGWTDQADLAVGDVVLTLNHETGFSEWQPVLDIYRADVVDERMFALRSSAHSSLSTPGHRWPVVKTGPRVSGSRRRWTTSAEGFATTDRVPLAAPLFEGPAEAKYADDFVRLVVAFTGDGTVLAHGNVRIAKFDEREIIETRRILTSLFGADGFREHAHPTTTIDGTAFVLRQAEAAPLLELCDTGKVVPLAFVDALTATQRRVFLDSCIEIGDGVQERDGATVLYQVEPQRLDAFAYAAHLLGYKVTTGVRKQQTGFGTRPLSWVRWTLKRSVFSPADCDHQVVPYTGTIWCPVTENHTWFARRDGKCYFTGNTAWLLRDEAFQSNVEPLLILMCDAITQSYLWPALAAAGVENPERFIVWYNPTGVVSDPDQGSKALQAHEAILISDDRARRDLGYTDDDKPSDEERRDRIAIAAFLRNPALGSIPQLNGESIPATKPTGVAASVIEATASEPDPTLRELPELLGDLDRALFTEAHQRADAAMRRVLERANARLRSLALRDASMKTLVADVDSASLGVAPALGPALVARLLGATEDNPGEDIVGDGFAAYLAWYDERAGRTAEQVVALMQAEGMDDVAHDAALARLAEERQRSTLVLQAGLVTLAGALLLRPEPLRPPGETDGLLVPPGHIREALRVAGGGGARASSMMTGDLVTGLWRQTGVEFGTRVWRYGDPAMRRTVFEPHHRLNGKRFAHPDDDVLANASGGWPGVSHFWPGDHHGCLCLTLLAAPSRSRSPRLPSPLASTGGR